MIAHSPPLAREVACSAYEDVGLPRSRAAPGSSLLTGWDLHRRNGLPYRHYGRAYEIDHIVPLGPRGSNAIGNLYPEAERKPAPGYRLMALRYVQKAIATNWVRLYRQL